jgi:hypothetical protein
VKKTGYSILPFMPKGEGYMGKNDHRISRNECPRRVVLKQNRAWYQARF